MCCDVMCQCCSVEYVVASPPTGPGSDILSSAALQQWLNLSLLVTQTVSVYFKGNTAALSLKLSSAHANLYRGTCIRPAL